MGALNVDSQGLVGPDQHPESPASDAAWNDACTRLEAYLRSHQIGDRAHAIHLVSAILAEAKAQWEQGTSLSGPPDQSPLSLTIDLATRRIDDWFARLVHDGDAGRSRAAYYASGAHRRWPSAFLSENVPEDLRHTVNTAALKAGPDLTFSSLIRKEVDYGAMEGIARETWKSFSWSHVIRAFVIWAFVFVIVYGFYLAFIAG